MSCRSTDDSDGESGIMQDFMWRSSRPEDSSETGDSIATPSPSRSIDHEDFDPAFIASWAPSVVEGHSSETNAEKDSETSSDEFSFSSAYANGMMSRERPMVPSSANQTRRHMSNDSNKAQEQPPGTPELEKSPSAAQNVNRKRKYEAILHEDEEELRWLRDENKRLKKQLAQFRAIFSDSIVLQKEQFEAIMSSMESLREDKFKSRLHEAIAYVVWTVLPHPKNDQVGRVTNESPKGKMSLQDEGWISVNQLMQYRAVKCFDVPQQFVIDAIEAYPYLELLGGQVRRKPIDSSIHVARNKESPGVDPPLSNSGGTIFYLDFGSKAGNSHHQEGASNNGDKMKTPMKQILDNTNRADYVRHTHEVLGAESDTPQQGSRRFSLAGRCFNCGGDHKVNECTESFDAHRVRVNRNSMAELNSKRSPKHDFEADVRFWNSGHDVTKMQPGKASLSDNLRIALQLKDGEPFPWIDRMRDYGPPPYLFRRKELPVDLIKIYHNPESDEEVNSNHEPEEKSFAVAATSTADQDECISMDEDSDENDVYDNNSPVPVMVAAPRGKTIASPIPVTLPTSAMNQIPKVSSAVPEPTTPVPVPKLPYAVFRQSMPPSVSYTATPVWGQPSSYYHQHYSSSPVRAGHYSLDPAHGHHDHSYHGYYGPMYPPPLVPHHPHPPPPLSDPSPPPPPPPSAHIPSD